jgi:hypothetical protein
MPAPKFPFAEYSPRTVLGRIANKQMIIGIGNYIIRLEYDLGTLERLFIKDRIEAGGHRHEGPLRKMANKIAREEGLVQRTAEQRLRLLRVIGNATNSSSLIRALHREFLEEEKPYEAAN